MKMDKPIFTKMRQFMLMVSVILLILLLSAAGVEMSSTGTWTIEGFQTAHDWTFSNATADLPGQEIGRHGVRLQGVGQFSARAPVGKLWSGYSGLEVALSSKSALDCLVSLTDWDNEVWTSDVKRITIGGNRLSFPFDGFTKSGGNGNGFFDLNDIKDLALDFESESPAEIILDKIDLFGSKGCYGPSVYIDPSLSYYNAMKKLDWRGLAKEVKDKGFTRVSLVVVRKSLTNWEDIISAFHEEGMKVVAAVWPMIWEEAYAAHPEWRMVMLGGGSQFDWAQYICPLHPEARQWILARIKQIFSQYQFDGFAVAESWWEVEGGPYYGNPSRAAYACVCEHHVKQYLTEFPGDPNPRTELFNIDSPNYFELHLKRGDPYFSHWVPWRQDTLYDFLGEMVAVVRETKPGAEIRLMYQGDVWWGYNRLEEYIGQQLEKALTRLKPDTITIESSWRDWARKVPLGPDLTRKLKYNDTYPERIKKVAPDVKIAFNTDIGSVEASKRSYQWIKDLVYYSSYPEKPERGIDANEFYEYSVASYIEEFPLYVNHVETVRQQGKTFVKVVFNKDHDADTALNPQNYVLVGPRGRVSVIEAQEDYTAANIVRLVVPALIEGEGYRLYVTGVAGDDRGKVLNGGVADFTASFAARMIFASFEPVKKTIRVQFDTGIQGNDQLQAKNYHLDGGAAVTKIEQVTSNTVFLHVKGLIPGQLYTITYTNGGNTTSCRIEAPLF